MEKFGWRATDNTNDTWSSYDFLEYPGGSTSWSQFVETLEITHRYLSSMCLMWNHVPFWMPPKANAYSFYYTLEVELGATNESRRSMVGVAVGDKLATIRTVNEDGMTDLTSVYIKDATILKPTPYHDWDLANK